MFKSFFLNEYANRGYGNGLIVACILLACSLVFFVTGFFIISDMILDLRLFSFLGDSFSGGRGTGRLLGFVSLAIFTGILLFLSIFFYNKWVNQYKKMTREERMAATNRGESVKLLLLAGGGFFALISLIIGIVIRT